MDKDSAHKFFSQLELLLEIEKSIKENNESHFYNIDLIKKTFFELSKKNNIDNLIVDTFYNRFSNNYDNLKKINNKYSFYEYIQIVDIISFFNFTSDYIEKNEISWSYEKALEEWAKKFSDIYSDSSDSMLSELYINNEIKLYKNKVHKWQKTIVNLINYLLENETKIQKESIKFLKGNSGILLLILLVSFSNICVDYNETPYIINEDLQTKFNEWVSGLGKKISDLPEQKFFLLRELNNLNLSKIKLDTFNLEYINFSNSNLSESKLLNCVIFEANFDNTRLIEAYISNSIIHESFCNTNCRRASFSNSTLKGDFTGADFSGATFSNTDIEGFSNLISDFSEADFSETIFSETTYNKYTKFPKGFDPTKVGGLIFVEGE